MSRNVLMSSDRSAMRHPFPAPEPFGALLVAGIAAVLLLGPLISGPSMVGRFWLLIALLVLSAVPLLWRTRAPVLVLILVVTLQGAVFAFWDGFRLPSAQYAFLAVLIALGAVAASRPFRVSLPALALAYAGIVFCGIQMVGSGDLAWILFSSLVLCTFAWGLGAFAWVNRRRIAALESDQERSASAVNAERRRIAAELNGIITIAVDRMLAQTTVARESIERDRARTADALGVIEATGVEAMNELRRLLHLLHDDPSFVVEVPRDSSRDVLRGPLSRRLRHPRRSDVVPAVGAILATVALTVASLQGDARWLASVYFVVVLVALVWRHRLPITVFVLVVAAHAGAVLLFHDGDFVWDASLAMVPVLVALSAVASRCSPWISVPVLLVAWGYLAIPSLAYPYAFAENVAISGVGALAVWAAGAYAGKRRRAIMRLENAQDAAMHAVQQERARVAYDLHDVIGHAITVMVLQAAGARRILDRDPARATEALTAVEAAGAEATRELDQLVGVLTAASATDPGSAGESPMRLADMDGLIERARAAVREIRVAVDGSPRRLEPSVDLAAYCVVREALYNAVKHVGPDAQVDIAVSWGDGRVWIDVTSSGAGSAPSHSTELSVGYGLVGVRERVRVAGGELKWSAGDDGFTVKADLPTVPAR